MWLLSPYLTRKWPRVAASTLLVTVATCLVITAATLLQSNVATTSFLEQRAQHLVEVTGTVSEAELADMLPDETIDIIPAAVAYLRYPLLFGRSAMLPVYGITEAAAETLLTAASTSLAADTLVPEFDGLYVPARFLQARGTELGAELAEQYLGKEHIFTILGTLDSAFDFALASRDTITNLSIQEPALLIHSSETNAESLEAMLHEKLSGRRNVRVVGPSYFADLGRERIREMTMWEILCTLVTGVVLMGVLLVHTAKQQLEIAVEQAVARLYRSGVQTSLPRPLMVGIVSGVFGWLTGVLLALAGYLIISRLLGASRGMVVTVPWKWICITGSYILVPIACQILIWIGTLRIDAATFLAQTPASLLPKPEAVQTDNRPSQSIGL